jgi:hypothetical protein
MTWKNITIKKHIEICNAGRNIVDLEEKELTLLSIIHDKPVEYFENIPIYKLKKLISELTFLNSKEITKGVPTSLRVNGKRYLVNLDMSDKNGAQFIDFTNYTKDETTINNNFHNIISILLSPTDWLGRDKFKLMLKKAKTKDEIIVVSDRITAQRSLIANELLEHLTMDKVFQISHFFFLLSERLLKSTMDYSMKLVNKEMKIVSKNLTRMVKKDLRNIGGGL